MDRSITIQDLSSMIKPHCKKYQKPPIPKNSANSVSFKINKNTHKQKCTDKSMDFTKFLLKQWPAPLPLEVGFNTKYVNLDDALEVITPHWQSIYAGL